MKRGTFKISYTGKRRDFIIQSEESKFVLKQKLFIKPIEDIVSLNNKAVSFDLNRGKVVQIKLNNETIYNLPKAKSPYNFVPLNSNSKFINPELIHENKYYSEGYHTGQIELSCTNFTPVYVRGTLALDTNNPNTYRTVHGNIVQILNYSPAGRLGIPGSSLRGTLRTLTEIVTFGKFGPINNDSLYYRSFADEALSIRKQYQDAMGANESDIKAGLIIKSGRHYKLIPNGEYTKVPRKDQGIKQYFKRISEGLYLVHSGFIDGKKNDLQIRCSEDKSQAIIIPEEDIHDYENDFNRSSNAINLLKEAKSNDFVPCFYFEWKDEDKDKDRYTFGHTRFFRIPYIYSPLYSISKNLRPCEISDITDSLFGTFGSQSKLYVEDLDMISGEILDESVPAILGSPKATSFQLYLDQDEKDIEDLLHYDSDNSIIRGNKLYWHKSPDYNWKASGEQRHLIEDVKTGKDKQRSIIKPIKAGAKFKGRIRFENLSTIELGALLFVLQLKHGYCLKIGMGKPIGLGSLELKTKVFISDRKQRYQSLKDQWIGTMLELQQEEIKTIVQEYMDEIWNIEDPSMVGQDLWEHPRLKELGYLLDWQNKPPDAETEYMKLSDFKHRMVLPRPSQIKKR